MWIIRLALKRPYTFVVAIFVISKGSACAPHPPSHSFGAAGRDAATVALSNWIAFIALNRFTYGRIKLRGNLCH